MSGVKVLTATAVAVVERASSFVDDLPGPVYEYLEEIHFVGVSQWAGLGDEAAV
jgi:hypothetical protein